MAKKRSETKENIFVTNEYFEKLGVSRQVVEYQRTSKRIDSAGMIKGMNLYFKLDADLMILKYWMNNLHRFVSEWEKTSEADGASSAVFPGVRELFKQYRLDETEMGQLDHKRHSQLIDIGKEINSFLFRLCAYRESKLSLSDYKKKEKAKIAHGNNYHDIFKYFLAKHEKSLSPEEIEGISSDLIEDL